MGGRGGASGMAKGGGSSLRPKFTPMSSKEMKSASDSQLRESLRQLATEYYGSGKSGISFGGADIDSVVNSLMSQKRSRASMIKDYNAMKKRLGYK